MVKKKVVDFSSFKGFIFKSPYITLYKSEKKIETSYETFDFNLGKIIPSLYGHSIYSINIISFVSKELKAEIIKDSITNKDYLNSFSISNLIRKNNPIIIKFIVPDKKVEKKEDFVIDLNFNISGLNSGDIIPRIIKNKISFSLLPLTVIIYSKKSEFIWNDNKLILDEDTFKEGEIIKINFKILNFEGNYDSFENNYTLTSFENNDIDRPKIGFENKESSALFKIKIPKLKDDTKNNYHSLFSLYFSKNLIIPIEIQAKINKRDFGLFYYDKYTGEILNHTSNKEILIYIYKQKVVKTKVVKLKLYFRIQCNDSLEEKDDTEHFLTINVPKGDELLSFDLTKGEMNKKFKDGITIKMPISISNFSGKEDYDKLNNYISRNNFEIEFICDNNSKKFTLKFLIEKEVTEDKIRYLSVPYFIHKGNEFIKLDEMNFTDFKGNDIFFNYEQLNYVKKNKKYKLENLRKNLADIEFISDQCKFIFIIKDFKIKHNVIIWAPYKSFNKYKIFHKSEIEYFNEANIEQAKKEIEDVYKNSLKFIKKHKNFEDIKKDNFGNIERMTDFISYICTDSVSKEKKAQLLVKLSEWFEEREKLTAKIKDLLECDDNKKLPIIYHNIIFTVGNIIKAQIMKLEKCGHNYLYFLEKKLSPQLIKIYNEEEFDNKVKENFCKKNEGPNLSKNYQFDEFSNEPKKLDKIPKEKKVKDEKSKEINANKIEIETESLNNYKNILKDISTIDKGLELIKNSYNITQSFPFFIQKIENKDANDLFQSLYSVYEKYADYNKSIISEDSYRFCLLFQNLCRKLKKDINLNDFEKIKNLETDTNMETANLFDYPKLKDINIPKEKKWVQDKKEDINTKYLDLGNFEKVKNELVIQPKLNKEKRDIDAARQSVRKAKTFKDYETSKKEEEEEKKEVDLEIYKIEEDDDGDNEEKYIKESDAPPKEIMVDALKNLKNTNASKYFIELMKLPKRKNKKLIIPDSFPENKEISEMLSPDSILGEELKDPSNLIMEFSKKISLRLFQASVNGNTQTEKICAIIALDCCRTIDVYHKYFHAVLAFGIINCLNALEIPYSVVLFADFKFNYTIKTFDEPHKESIFKLILDCIMIERYSSRIADACIYIKQKVIHPQISNRRIFLISNGLDPNLRYG